MSTDVQAIQKLSNFQGDHLSVHMDGGGGAYCRGDVICLFDADMTAADNTLTSATAAFTSADIGKLLKVYNAGPGVSSPHLYGRVKSVTNANTIKVGDAADVDLPADRTVTAAQAMYGTDYTAHFQALIIACNSLYIPFGSYAILGPLTVRPGVRIYGQCKGAGLFFPGASGPGTANAALGSCLVNFSESSYTFEYLSTNPPDQIQDGFTFERMTLIAKFGIRINDPTASVASQSHIHPVTISDILFLGDYDYPNDPESFTATLPTITGSANSLDLYGIGVTGRKLLRCEIKDCTFYFYGCSVWMCDWSQSSIRHTRLVHGGLFIWHGAEGVEANRNKIINNEIIEYSRVGGIYIEYANGLLIHSNWFEQISTIDFSEARLNATYIWSDFDDNLRIADNYFLDNYSHLAPLYRLSPRFPALVSGNQFLSSGTTAPFAEIDTAHYINTTFTVMAKCYGNGENFPVPDYPGVVPLAQPDPYLMRYNNPGVIRGAVTATFPWVQSAVTGRWVISSATAGFIWLVSLQSRAHRNYRLAIAATKVPATSDFFISVYYYNFVGNVIDATAANPVVLEVTAHGLTTGDVVFVQGVLVAGFSGTPANGQQTITVVDANHISLNGVNGSASDPYSQGGTVHLRSYHGTYNTGITDEDGLEMAYVEFGLPASMPATGFWGIDTNNERAEIESMELVPFEDYTIHKSRDGLSTPLTDSILRLQTYDGVDQATFSIDGRPHIPTSLTGVLYKTANYTLLPTDHYVGADTTSGALTLTLPLVANTYDATRGLGQRYLVKWLTGSNALTIDGNGSETIDGALTYLLKSVGDAVILQNNGAGWNVIGTYSTIEGAWRWVSVGVSIRTDYQVGIGRNPGASKLLDVAGIAHADQFRSDNFTANQPIKTNGSKDQISGPIDLANNTNEVGGILDETNGGTGASTIAGARTNLSVYSIAEIDTIVATIYAVVAGKATAGTQTGSSAGHTHTQSA